MVDRTRKTGRPSTAATPAPSEFPAAGRVRAVIDQVLPADLSRPADCRRVERRLATNASHARIYSALVAGDVDLAQREVRDHLQTAFNSLLDEMRDPPKMNGQRG